MNSSLRLLDAHSFRNPQSKCRLPGARSRVLGADQGATRANKLEMGKVPGFAAALGGCEEPGSTSP